jgi:hypothetical protein
MRPAALAISPSAWLPDAVFAPMELKISHQQEIKDVDRII